MKKVLIPVLLLFLSHFAYCLSYTISPYFGVHGFIDTYAEDGGGSSGPGLGLRAVFCPNVDGFYLGGDLFVSTPPILNRYPDTYGDELFISLKFPLGYRLPYQGKAMSFYIGGGPVLQMLSIPEVPGDTIDWYFSLLLESGLQTNRTEGVGFHVGLQISLCPYMWPEPNLWFLRVPPIELLFQIGISFRRVPD